MAQICRRTLQTTVLFATATIMAACDGERSSNPLSPNIAGPLAGVTITTPAAAQPVDGQLITVDAQPVTLTFQSAVSNSPRPFRYEVQITENGSFASILQTFEVEQSGGSDIVSFELPLLLNAGVYYWRTRALDGANTSVYSNTFSFEIFIPITIEALTLSMPPDGSTTQALDPLLVVDNVTITGGTATNIEYRFEIATTQSFASLVATLLVPQGPGSTTSAQPGNLDNGQAYFWRVRVSAMGPKVAVTGPYSVTWSFITQSITVPASTLSMPPDGSTTQVLNPLLVVDNVAITGGTVTDIEYRFEIATTQSFATLVATSSAPQGPGSTTSVQPGNLVNDQTYFWRVRVSAMGPSAEVIGPYSVTWSFNTLSAVGGAIDELDLSQVVWLHHNVSAWPKTSTITSTTIGAPPLCIVHTKIGMWPTGDFSGNGQTADSNPWVFAKVNDTWYAATWEWLRPNQTCKDFGADDFRTHVKVPVLDNWTPQSGELIGLMISTPARFGPDGPVQERTNVVLRTWP